MKALLDVIRFIHELTGEILKKHGDKIEETPAEPEGTKWDRFLKTIATSEVVPNWLKPVITAQAILESGRGTSALAQEHNNFFGHKYRKELSHIATPTNYEAHDGLDSYAHYQSPEVADVAAMGFFGRSPYKGWETFENDPSGFLQFIRNAGYAEDPNYVAKVLKLMTEARKLLSAHGADLDEPERPDMPDGGLRYEVPTFKELPSDIKFDNQGNYRTVSGKASGVVVHYTVSGDSPIGVARYMAGQGYGCLVMGHDGVIWHPRGWDWVKQWDDHAGTSSWPTVSGTVSKYFYGIEICNWGKLNSETKPKAREIRRVSVKDNMKAGEYEAYSEAQEKALINFCLWQLDTNPEFKLENIVGHDEVAPGRKSDPGGSLSMTMPELRARIKLLATKSVLS